MSAPDPSSQLITLLSRYLTINEELAGNSSSTPECELKFGTRGVKPISKIDFDNVVQRLKSNGFILRDSKPASLLRIMPEYIDSRTGQSKISNVRCELVGLNNIQKYCKNNSLPQRFEGEVDATFQQKQIMRVDDSSLVNPVNFDDFNFRVTLNNETNLNQNSSPIVRSTLETWNETKKVFRYITRFSFKHSSLPIIADLSIVKESNRRGPRLVPEYTIQDSGVFDNREKYEIEMEVDIQRSGFGANKLADSLRKCALIVLRGLQESNYPISYPEQKSILVSYASLFDSSINDQSKITSRLFIGPNPTTLQLANVAPIDSDSNIPNIRKNYTVTEKADGLRKLLYISGKGKIYLINVNMSVQFTGAITSNPSLFNTLLDGEHILHDKNHKFINLYAAFDIYFLNKVDVRALPLVPTSEEQKEGTKARLSLLIDTVKSLKPTGTKKESLPPIRIGHKRFYVESESTTIFNGCKTILQQISDGLFDYETDGLIFTPARLGVGASREGDHPNNFKSGWEHAFKWKPPHLNTIDFLVSTVKNPSGNDLVKSVFQNGTDASALDQLTQYKSLVLRVGFDERKHGYINPCGAMIDGDIPSSTNDGKQDNYRPMQFFPTNPYDADAGKCDVLLKEDATGSFKMFTEEGEPFDDGTIVEFSYDVTKEGPWRWSPLRVRYDKTADYRSGGKNYGNAYHVANTNWHSLHNPVTEEMISSGMNIPPVLADDEVYYNRATNTSDTRGLRDFHNLFVKKRLITSVSKSGNTLIDYAVGKAGDMSKWIAARLSFVFGVDISKDNIENRLDGACARYLKYKSKMNDIPAALYVHGNGSVNLRDGAGLFSESGKRIARAVFGEGVRDEKELGKGVYAQFGKGKAGFNVSSIQFAIHYMFQDLTTLVGFLRNVAECTKLGGYFIGTTYDGKQIFNMLSDKQENESVSIQENGAKIWEITKRYDRTDFESNSSSLGFGIDVYQESINKTFREYLVNFPYLTNLLSDFGFEVISATEAKKMNLPNGVGSFKQLYGLMEQEMRRNPDARSEYGTANRMSNGEKRISFLNQYFIYKKERQVDANKIAQMIMNKDKSEILQDSMASLEAQVQIEETKQVIKPKVRRTRRKLVLKE